MNVQFLRSRPISRRKMMVSGILFALSVSCTSAQGTTGSVTAQTTDNNPAWNALAQGGHAVLFRHSKTDTGNGETPNYRYGVCATERQLNEAGRVQARRIGEAFRERNIQVGEVLSSAWCRCRDTAQLAFGRHIVWTPLNVINSQFNPKVDREKQISDVIARIAQLQRQDNLILVTHHLNVEALTGEFTAEGEGIVVRYDQTQRNLLVVGRLPFP